MRTKLSAIMGILSIAVLMLSACGGSTSGAANTSPIVVGELFPMTGREPFVGDWFNHGAKVAVYEINHNGGVLGRQLNPILADTAGDAVDAVTALQQLRTNNPTFILGPSSLEIAGVINQFDPNHLPDFVEGGTTQLDHMTNSYVFRTTPSDSTLAVGMSYYAITKLSCTQAGYFFENTSNASGVIAPLVASYTAHGGTIQTGEDVEVTPHQTSYRSEVEKLFANSPQCIFMQTDPQTASTFFSDVRQLGHLNVPFILTDAGADINMAKALGLADAAKWMTGMNGSPPAGPAWQHFTEVYNTVWGTNKPVTLSQNTYDSAIIAALAITEAGTTDPTVWIKHVNSVVNTAEDASAVKVNTYADGVTALKAGKKIDFEGASGSDDYNQFHNVAGGWDVVQFDASSNLNTVFTVPESQIAAWTPSS